MEPRALEGVWCRDARGLFSETSMGGGFCPRVGRLQAATKRPISSGASSLPIIALPKLPTTTSATGPSLPVISFTTAT